MPKQYLTPGEKSKIQSRTACVRSVGQFETQGQIKVSEHTRFLALLHHRIVRRLFGSGPVETDKGGA